MATSTVTSQSYLASQQVYRSAPTAALIMFLWARQYLSYKPSQNTTREHQRATNHATDRQQSSGPSQSPTCVAGKTLIARACAAQTNATFLKLAGPQLVQMFIGDGAKLVRDAFALAKEKAPCIIFIDEIDAIGTKRFDSEVSGDREVQRTMLELLNQLDGFSSDENIKIIAATNRADILDPALMRSGRLDRKIEFPHPTEDARAKIIQIHARKMNVSPDVNFDELARSTDDFNAAQLKAVCVEAGMLALRRDATEVNHEDFNEGIIAVQAKKKANLNYYA